MNEEKSPFKGDLEGPDVFKTITDNIGEGYYTEKRSKFFAYAHHVRTADEVKALHQMYKKKYYDARHVCYAYRLGADGAEFSVLVLMVLSSGLMMTESLRAQQESQFSALC